MKTGRNTNKKYATKSQLLLINLLRSLQNCPNFSKRTLKEQNLAFLASANFAKRFIQSSLLLIIFLGTIAQAATATEGCYFKRGDINNDGKVDISDPVTLLNYLFSGTNINCQDAADVDDNGILDISDPIALLSYLFQGGQKPATPFVDGIGIDITQDVLSCNNIADSICQEKENCGFGKISQKCACNGKTVTSGYCCFGFQEESCFIQTYEKDVLKKQNDKLERNADIAACAIQKISSQTGEKSFIGCEPYNQDKEFKLTSSSSQQINPSYYNGKENSRVVWEESSSSGANIYYCNLNSKVKKPSDCEQQKILVALGVNPSIDASYIVWEDNQAIWACDLSLTSGDRSCLDKSIKIKLITKNTDSFAPNFATPILRDGYILYREKIGEGKYSLYTCTIKKDSGYSCIPKLISSGSIDLPIPGDILDGKVVFAAKDSQGVAYNLFFYDGENIFQIAQGTSLYSSPQIFGIVSGTQKSYFAIWKDLRSNFKDSINIQLLDDLMSPKRYRIISPGYMGSDRPIVICNDQMCFIQDKIIGSFDKNQGQFINQLFTCDLTSLVTGDYIYGCPLGVYPL